MGKFSVEVKYEVWDDEHGVKLVVGPDSDTGGWVQISVNDPKSKEFYGDLRLVLDPDAASHLASCLQRCAMDLLKP